MSKRGFDPLAYRFEDQVPKPGKVTEIAEGVFPVFMNPDRFDLYQAALEEGFAKAGGGKGLHNFDVAPFVNVIVGDDLVQDYFRTNLVFVKRRLQQAGLRLARLLDRIYAAE